MVATGNIFPTSGLSSFNIGRSCSLLEIVVWKVQLFLLFEGFDHLLWFTPFCNVHLLPMKHSAMYCLFVRSKEEDGTYMQSSHDI